MTDQMTDRLLLWLPAGLGGLVALLVLGLGAAPLISQLQQEGRQLEQKQALEQRLPQIRVAMSRLVGEQQRAERQQQQVLTLIAGSGELVTFLAQVDRLAQRHRVQLQLFEPTTAQPAGASEAADPLKAQAKGTRAQQQNQQQATAAPPDPLQKAGLSSSRLLLSARGTFQQLLAFLRAVESLSLLVVQSNLNLNQALTDKPGPSSPPASAPGSGSVLVELKLALALYRPTARR